MSNIKRKENQKENRESSTRPVKRQIRKSRAAKRIDESRNWVSEPIKERGDSTLDQKLSQFIQQQNENLIN